MHCDCVKKLNERISKLGLNLDLVGDRLNLEYDSDYKSYDVNIPIKYCPICGLELKSDERYIQQILCELPVGTEENARLVFNFIKTITEETKIKDFIEDLVIHSDKEKAFDWIYEDTVEYHINFTITKDMVGKDIKDILLSECDNYKKLSEDLHLTWYA